MRHNFPVSRAIIRLDLISKNINSVKSLHPRKKVLAVVKCNAYGHGATQVAKHIEEEVDWYGLATVDEGIELRMAGIKKPILIFAVPTAETAATYVTHNLTATVSSKVHFSILMDGTAYHINFDTGMNRLGFKPEEAQEVRRLAVANQRLICSGVYSHYATADDPGSDIVYEQQKRFQELSKYFSEVPLLHMSNSGALTHYPDLNHFDMVRCGLNLLGYSAGKVQTDRYEPVLEWRTELVQVRPISKGEGVSYGSSWRAPEDGFLGTIEVGYGDGLPRSLTNKLEVLIERERYPLVGNVTMDYVMVYLKQNRFRPDTEVLLLGKDGASAAEWAELAGTNVHEILTGLRSSVERRYLNRK